MLASKNGDVTVCVTNLMRIRRGECPYARVKGINNEIIDSNLDDAELELLEDAEFNLEQFEERALLEDIEFEPEIFEDGSYSIKFQITDRNTDEDADDIEENI